MSRPLQHLKTLLRNIAFAFIAAIVLFEEWGWEPLAALFARLARLPLWAWMERKITLLPPWGAVLVFGVPVITLLPVKLGALYLFAHGNPTLGLMLLLGAKLVGTAVLARLFQLTQPSLMQLDWFARWYPGWKAWKDQLIQDVHASAPWRIAGQFNARARVWWKAFRARM
jgi:hypothetical protein